VLREVRIEEDGKAHVPLRHGQVFKRVFNKSIGQRPGVRRMFLLVLRGM
jgi:hypothetical protein